jgi:hypothetical protein
MPTVWLFVSLQWTTRVAAMRKNDNSNLEVIPARSPRASTYDPLTTLSSSYYDLGNMVEVVPVNGPADIRTVKLVWDNGVEESTSHSGHALQPCTFVQQTDGKCEIAELTRANNHFEGIIEKYPAQPLEQAEVKYFHQLSSYCRFTDTPEPPDASLVDWQGLQQLVQGLPGLAGRSYSQGELLKFVQAVAVVSEIQLRLPEIAEGMSNADMARFIPAYDKHPLPREFIEKRRLKRDGRPIKYKDDYMCDHSAAVTASAILQDLRCARLVFYRPPNYFRALVVACETHDGRKVLLAESKGSGLPRYAAHTKNLASMAYMYESVTGGGRKDVKFAFERAIERWRLSDHGSGKIDLSEAAWEYALSKYVELSLSTPTFKALRKESCYFMLNYLRGIYTREGYAARLKDRIYNNPFPEHLHGKDACDSVIDVVKHLTVLNTKFDSHQGDAKGPLVNQGLLIRGISKRSFDSIYTNPDLCGHPGANHFVAGIHTGLLGSVSLMMQDKIDITKNKQMQGERLKKTMMAAIKSMHKSRGKYFYVNIQADRARQRLFDYGHAGVHFPDRGIVHQNDQTTQELLEYVQAPTRGHMYTPAEGWTAATMRLFHGWTHVVLYDSGAADREELRLWMFNQILYWDPALALILRGYTRSFARLHEHFTAGLGISRNAQQCHVVAFLMEQLVKRTMELRKVSQATQLFDGHMIDKDFIGSFLRALDHAGATSMVCQCLWPDAAPTGQFRLRHTAPAACPEPKAAVPYAPTMDGRAQPVIHLHGAIDAARSIDKLKDEAVTLTQAEAEQRRLRRRVASASPRAGASPRAATS